MLLNKSFRQIFIQYKYCTSYFLENYIWSFGIANVFAAMFVLKFDTVKKLSKSLVVLLFLKKPYMDFHMFVWF